MGLVPEDGDADLGDAGVALLEVLDHFADRLAGVDHVVDEKDAALEFGDASDAVGDVKVGLDRALGFAVGARGENGKRHVVDAAEEVARAHAAARQAKDAVKLPAALGDHGNKLFAKVDVLFPGVRNVRHVCLSERAK